MFITLIYKYYIHYFASFIINPIQKIGKINKDIR